MSCKFCRAARAVAKKHGGFTGAVLEKNGAVLGRGAPKTLPEDGRAIDAEAIAVINALKSQKELRGATLHLTGHFWPCREQCLPLLTYCGITLFCIDPYTQKSNPDCKHHKPNE